MDVNASAKREIKTARDVRVALAEFDVPVRAFAELAGIDRTTLCNVMHGRYRLTKPMRIRLEKAAEELDKNPPLERDPDGQRVQREERFARRRTSPPRPPTQPEGVEPRVRRL